jgi:purine nucleoside phosphorylase
MLAIIGGTGIYELPGMQVVARVDAPTPFGQPSGVIEQGRLGGQPLLFLARHGAGHKLLPHEVNYRANIFALKRAGATQVLGFSAVGSPWPKASRPATWRCPANISTGPGAVATAASSAAAWPRMCRPRSR